MSASLKAGCDNHVHVRLLQCNRLVHSGRRSNQRDSLSAELIQNLFGGNAINEAEYGNPFVQENLYLIFETNWFIWAVGRLGSSDTIDMSFQRCEATIEGLFCRGEGSFVFH